MVHSFRRRRLFRPNHKLRMFSSLWVAFFDRWREFSPVWRQLCPDRRELSPSWTILSPSRTEYCPGWTEFSLKRMEFTLVRTEFPPPWRDFTPERTEFPPVLRELPPRAKMALLQRRRPFFARKMVPPWWMCSPQMPTGLYASHRTSGGMVTNCPSMQNGLPSRVTREPWARPAMRSQ